MPINSTKNLYPGVNAHLNSFLQQEDGGWESFHTEYLVALRQTLEKRLPPNYYAITEKSLQISEYAFGELTRRRTSPDVTVYQKERSGTRVTASSAAVAPSIILPLAKLLYDDDDYLVSVIVYQMEGGKYPGKPIVRIELLSPANKPHGSYYQQYLAKRLQTLRSGLLLVEIDFLHETPPLLTELPSYPDHDHEAFPYTIMVSKPYPTPEEGQAEVYNINVDGVLPVINFPLAEDDEVELDFGLAYNLMLENARAFQVVVDYEQAPVNFDRYTPEDQAKIRSLLEAIRQNATDERNAP